MSISIEGMNETSDFETSLEKLKDVEPQDNWTEEDWKHFKTIKAALEKQIPKKVVFEHNGEALLCPKCGFDLMGSINEPDHDPPYCFECGQALDWKD